MHRPSLFNTVSAAALAGIGLFTQAASGQLRFDIRVGAPPPPRERIVVVEDYNTYCVGYRHNLYDADWRLRNAQIEQWEAQDGLDAARHREGDIAVTVEDQEAIIAQDEKRVVEADAALDAARAAAGRAADDEADARARVGAFEKRARAAHEDLEAARTLRDGPGAEDAERRLHTNEAAAAVAMEDLRVAQSRTARLHEAEAAAAAFADARTRLADVHAHLPALREQLAIAHDEVFAAQQRLDAAIGRVALALHDRDEALWLLHRDEIYAGRATFESCGFVVDFSQWGGRPPRDPEVLHAYFVHPVDYWVERPVEIQSRVVEVDRVTEITHIRTIQRQHEGPRFAEVVRVEEHYPVERRREYFEKVTVERQRLVAERTERTTAAAEHRAPRIPETERAEARAIATRDRAQSQSARIESQAEARARMTQAQTDAHAKLTEAHADARAEEIKANADARAKLTEARGDALAETTRAQADARAKQTEARGAALAEETHAQADARARETEARGAAHAEETHAQADARARETEARGAAHAEETHAQADARARQSDPRARDSRSPAAFGDSSRNAPARGDRAVGSSGSTRGDRSTTSSRGRDPRHKNDGTDTASTDYNR